MRDDFATALQAASFMKDLLAVKPIATVVEEIEPTELDLTPMQQNGILVSDTFLKFVSNPRILQSK